MNFKDIANLRFQDITGDSITFYRSKTIRTNKQNLKLITVFLNDFTKGVIERYGKKNGSGKDFIFDIINESQDSENSNERKCFAVIY